MQLDISTLEQGVVCVKLNGRLDVDATLQIDNPFTFRVATIKQPVVVDLSQVEFIASLAMRMLVKSAKALDNRGGKLVLASPTAQVREALTVSGIATIIPMADDLAQACKLALGGMAP